MEKFSVLMSVYCREKGEYLRQALSSVFEQTLMPDEVILVEDGPLTDELYAVIEEFQDRSDVLKVVRLLQNVGLGQALNRGLSQCSYDLVVRMDSDDICQPDRFKQQMAVFVMQPNLSVVGSWVDEFENVPTTVMSVRKLPETPLELQKYAKSRNPLNHPSVMFRKAAINSVGGYKHFYLFEDYYLWARLIHSGFQIYNIQESLLYFRTNRDMIARRGGWKYAVSEVKFFVLLYKMGFIGAFAMAKNIILRFPIRVLPNQIRSFVYSKLLR